MILLRKNWKQFHDLTLRMEIGSFRHFFIFPIYQCFVFWLSQNLPSFYNALDHVNHDLGFIIFQMMNCIKVNFFTGLINYFFLWKMVSAFGYHSHSRKYLSTQILLFCFGVQPPSPGNSWCYLWALP